MEREKRMFWVNNDGAVVQAEGLSCAPENPTYWWFPKLGYSMAEGRSVFTDKQAAVEAARAELTARKADVERALAALEGGA